jgi:hypothetical protein
MQLNLLDLPPISVPDEPQPIADRPLPVTPANPHTLAWLNAKADYYLKLMNRFMDAKRIPQEVKQAEFLRVYELREQVLERIAELER